MIYILRTSERASHNWGGVPINGFDFYDIVHVKVGFIAHHKIQIFYLIFALIPRIIREITNFVRQVLESEVRKATANVVKQGPTDLKSIFGIGGKNSVKVDTQYIKYGYET